MKGNNDLYSKQTALYARLRDMGILTGGPPGKRMRSPGSRSDDKTRNDSNTPGETSRPGPTRPDHLSVQSEDELKEWLNSDDGSPKKEKP